MMTWNRKEPHSRGRSRLEHRQAQWEYHTSLRSNGAMAKMEIPTATVIVTAKIPKLQLAHGKESQRYKRRSTLVWLPRRRRI